MSNAAALVAVLQTFAARLPPWLDGVLVSYRRQEACQIRMVYTDILGEYVHDLNEYSQDPSDEIFGWLWGVSGPVRMWGSGLWTEMAW